MTKHDHYADIADRLISHLESILDGYESGQPWRKPWHGSYDSAPRNGVTERHYRGINALLLSTDPRNAEDPRWLTFNQAKKNGWKVKKGSKATTVYLMKQISKEEENEDGETERKTFPLLRSFKVFHASQVEGMPEWQPETRNEESAWQALECAEKIIDRTGADIRHGGSEAFYSPAHDFVTLPPRDDFSSADAYYATAFHELAHWTKGTGRVPRREGVENGKFGSVPYAKEEIRAEMASAMICSYLGVLGQDGQDCSNNVSYIRSWISALRDDKYEARRAAADAQKIADFILGDDQNEAQESKNEE